MDAVLWVPIVWRDKQIPGWYPDMPDGVDWSAEVPSELDSRLPMRIGPDAPRGTCQGDPAVRFCRVRVPEDQAARVTAAIAESDVPEVDRMLIFLHAAICSHADRRVGMARAREVLRQWRSGTPDEKAAIRRAMLSAVRHGMPIADAQLIVKERGL